MKILFITDALQIAQASGGLINDYMNDTLFFALKENLGEDVMESTCIEHLYKSYMHRPLQGALWGKGFTTTRLLESDSADRSNLLYDICNHAFDRIVYGSVWRCLDYYPVVKAHYKSHEIILVDGQDTPVLHPLFEKHPYFKRELMLSHKNLFPLSFALPTSKIAKEIPLKTQLIATTIPGNTSTYIFETEETYYDDYQKSFFGLTCKKAGWDTMRHYEILGNHCLPYFSDLSQCPPTILTTLPRDLIYAGMACLKGQSVHEEKYFDVLTEMRTYTQTHLTTKAMGKRFLEHIA